METKHVESEHIESAPMITIEQTAELYGINLWTLRMWINRLDEIKYYTDPFTGEMVLPERSVRLVGEVVALAQRGCMTLDMVREHLDLLLSEEL